MGKSWKCFVKYTVSANNEFRSWGDFSNEIGKPDYFISDCSKILS